MADCNEKPFAAASSQRRETEGEGEITYRNLFDAIDEGFCIIEVLFDGNDVAIDYRFVEVNASFERQTGLVDAVGKRMREFAPDHEEHWFEIYGRVARTGVSERFENSAARLGHYYEVYAFRVGDPAERRVGVLFKDIAERKRMEDALRDSEERFRVLVESWAQAVWETDPRGVATTDSPTWRQYTGQSLEQWRDGGWTAAVHPDEQADALRQWRDALATGSVLDVEVRIRAADGGYTWTNVRAAPTRGVDGAVRKWVGMNIDVSARRAVENQRRLLHDELNHRVKNTLAVVQSMARRTFNRETIAQASRAAFEGRLNALATAHDLLTYRHWERASLADIAKATAATCGPDGDRIFIAGPPVVLSPAQAVSMTMALHELCTNAIKYGALSNDEGTVDVEWRVSEGPPQRFDLAWRERGGPPVEEPTARGFGSMMIEQALAYDLGADVGLEFRPEGLTCTIAGPLSGMAG